MRCPELALHGRGVADEDVEALDLLGQLRDLLHLFHDGVIVLALKSEHERRADALAVHLDREHGVAGNIAGELHNVGIHVLDDGGGIVLCQQGVGGIEAGLGIHEREEQNSVGLGLVYELESKLGDDGQSTLAAYDRLKVCAAESLRAAVSTDDGERCDVVSGRAVLDGVGARGVGRGVAADGGGLLTGIGGIIQAALLGFGLDFLEQDAGLDAQGARGFIKFKDLIHGLEGEDYAARDGDGATGLAGACAAHGDGDACFGAELHDGGGLFGACDLGYGVGSPGNARALVMAVVCAYCVGGEKPAFADYFFYCFQHCSFSCYLWYYSNSFILVSVQLFDSFSARRSVFPDAVLGSSLSTV